MVVIAYMWWGLSALFWRELGSVAPLDQLGFRVGFGAFFLLLWAALNRIAPVSGVTSRHIGYGVFSALMIATNWAVFLWAIANGQAVEAALGYFLMPLFSVALGVVLLGERPTTDQKIALGLGTIGLVWTLAVLGSIPWVALALGGTFAAYGWARKVGPWEAVNGLTFETMLVAPIVVGIVLWRAGTGVEVTGDGELLTMVLIVTTGLITIVPLLLFASAARQVPLTTVGLLQYINPTLQFLVGWQIFGEDVPAGRLIGFAWIWVALGFVVRSELRAAKARSASADPPERSHPNSDLDPAPQPQAIRSEVAPLPPDPS